MEMLTQMQDTELQNLNGGVISPVTVLEVIGVLVGLYAFLQDQARQAGEAAAYRDLGM